MRAFLVALTLTLAPTAFAGGADCDPTVDTGETPAGRFYVEAGADGGLTLWIYQESNGEPGCNGDTILF